jgi:sugar phosphate isomerase/epimerase
MLNKGEYSFSTCWNIKRHTVGREMIEEIKELGFRNVELNYNVTEELLTTIEPMIERAEIGISSVHNVFPFVNDKDYDTDSVLLGYDDEVKRKRSVELLIRSMEYAVRYGAKAVVVHPGEVPFAYNIDSELKRLYRDYGKDSPEYQKLWNEMLDQRERMSAHYSRRIQDSLEEVSNHAAMRGWNVAIGIETRARCYQMPTLLEAKTICDNLKGSPVSLWYDIGHAMMMDRMGLYDNLQDLQEVKRYIYGVHIHETLELSDHYCPYVHSKDLHFFDHFLEVINLAQVKVYELKAVCQPDEIHESHNLITHKIAALTQKVN